MNESKSRIEQLNSRIKNNPVLATMIVLGSVVIALSSFTNAAKNIWETVRIETRPAINGEWESEVTYDWENAKYSEKFKFNGDNEVVKGTASFLGTDRGILEGKVKNNKLQFILKTKEIDGQGTKEAVHLYQGDIVGDEIKFVMQTDGGFTEHIPIMFSARRVSVLR